MNATKTLITATLVTLLGTTAACGGSSGSGAARAADSPNDADQKSFCNGLAKIPQDASRKESVARVQKIGTPSDVTAQERKGYVTLLDTLSKLPDGGVVNLNQLHISSADKADVQAFIMYSVKTCQPTGAPSR